jgi:hypothetical protein
LRGSPTAEMLRETLLKGVDADANRSFKDDGLLYREDAERMAGV